MPSPETPQNKQPDTPDTSQEDTQVDLGVESLVPSGEYDEAGTALGGIQAVMDSGIMALHEGRLKRKLEKADSLLSDIEWKSSTASLVRNNELPPEHGVRYHERSAYRASRRANRIVSRRSAKGHYNAFGSSGAQGQAFVLEHQEGPKKGKPIMTDAGTLSQPAYVYDNDIGTEEQKQRWRGSPLLPNEKNHGPYPRERIREERRANWSISKLERGRIGSFLHGYYGLPATSGAEADERRLQSQVDGKTIGNRINRWRAKRQLKIADRIANRVEKRGGDTREEQRDALSDRVSPVQTKKSTQPSPEEKQKEMERRRYALEPVAGREAELSIEEIDALLDREGAKSGLKAFAGGLPLEGNNLSVSKKRALDWLRERISKGDSMARLSPPTRHMSRVQIMSPEVERNLALSRGEEPPAPPTHRPIQQTPQPKPAVKIEPIVMGGNLRGKKSKNGGVQQAVAAAYQQGQRDAEQRRVAQTVAKEEQQPSDPSGASDSKIIIPDDLEEIHKYSQKQR